MTPTRLREVLDTLRWSQRDLAFVLMCNERLVRRWASGDASLPPGIESWLEGKFAQHQATPPPTDWRRRDPVAGISFSDNPGDFQVIDLARGR